MDQKTLTNAARKMAESLHSTTGALLSGKIDLDIWYEKSFAAINEGHKQAWIVGRTTGGDKSKPSTEDDVEARRIADYQSEYLDKFRDKLESGYYDDKADAALSRCDLYALSIRGTSTESWAATCEEDDEIKWRLGDGEHCEDCIELAAQTYTAATIYVYPGQGDTACGSHCNCHLERTSDGSTSPKRINLND